MTDDELAGFKARLIALREDLLALSATSAEDRKPVALDQQTQGRLARMDAMRAQAMDQATEGKRRAEIKRIEAALARIETDTFGDCARCGDEIAAKRMALDPAAALCVACAGR